MQQDEEAIQSVISGDRDAFRLLVERHRSAVCATIRALLPRYADWEDIAQEVFLAAYRRLATFDATKGAFRAWLLAISRNQCRSVSQRPGTAQVDTIPDLAHGKSPESLASEAEWFERLDTALAGLPAEQRLAFVLVEMQGLSYQEAADVSEATVGTLKSRLFRAKQWLREALQCAANDDKCAAGPQRRGNQ